MHEERRRGGGGERKGQRKKEQKQTRDTCGGRRSGLRLKPHKKNNFAVGEEIRERGRRRREALAKGYFFFLVG